MGIRISVYIWGDMIQPHNRPNLNHIKWLLQMSWGQEARWVEEAEIGPSSIVMGIVLVIG